MTRLVESAPSSPPAPNGGVKTPGRIGGRIAWTWVLLSAVAIAAYAVIPYLTSSLEVLTETGGGLAGTYVDQPLVFQLAFYAHIVGGGVALVLGPLQFWRRLRTRHPRAHRIIGRAYLAGIAVGGVAALVIAPVNSAGFVGLFGFGGLGVLWLVTGWRAYRSIRRGDVASHQAWMIRNFAITYSAVTLRLWLGLLIMVQVPLLVSGASEFDAVFANAYAAVPFLCWVPNIVVAEWLIRRRGLPSYRLPETLAA